MWATQPPRRVREEVQLVTASAARPWWTSCRSTRARGPRAGWPPAVRAGVRGVPLLRAPRTLPRIVAPAVSNAFFAALDRLAHQATVLLITGRSYRLTQRAGPPEAPMP